MSEELVETGFGAIAEQQAATAPAVEKEPPVQEAKPEPEPEPEPKFVHIPDETRARAEGPESQNAKANRELFDKIMAARNTPPPVIIKQPPIPHIMEQTKREMEAGRRQSELHAERQRLALATRKPLSAAELAAQSTSTAIFRPGDYVPDPKKGQGAGLQPRDL